MPEIGVLTRTYFPGGQVPDFPTSHAHKLNSRPEIDIYATLHFLLTLNIISISLNFKQTILIGLRINQSQCILIKNIIYFLFQNVCTSNCYI